MFEAKNKNKMRKDNQLCEIEIREVDNEKKRIKIHYKGFREDTDEWRDYGSLFDLEGFHAVVNFELIFRSGFHPFHSFASDFPPALLALL